MEITFTHHAISRFGHRGIRKSDLHLIAEYGSIAEQGMLLTRKDIASAGRSARKRLLDRLWKLQGVFVAMDGRKAITAFRVTRRQRRRQTRLW